MGYPCIWQNIIFVYVYEDVSRWNDHWNWWADSVIWFTLPDVCGHHWIWTFEELNRTKRWRKKEFTHFCLIAWAETATALHPWDSWFLGFRLGLRSASLLSSFSGLWTLTNYITCIPGFLDPQRTLTDMQVLKLACSKKFWISCLGGFIMNLFACSFISLFTNYWDYSY